MRNRPEIPISSIHGTCNSTVFLEISLCTYKLWGNLQAPRRPGEGDIVIVRHVRDRELLEEVICKRSHM